MLGRTVGATSTPSFADPPARPLIESHLFGIEAAEEGGIP